MSDSSKPCPFCGEQILAVAIKCKHCGSMLSAPPQGYDTGLAPQLGGVAGSSLIPARKTILTIALRTLPFTLAAAVLGPVSQGISLRGADLIGLVGVGVLGPAIGSVAVAVILRLVHGIQARGAYVGVSGVIGGLFGLAVATFLAGAIENIPSGLGFAEAGILTYALCIAGGVYGVHRGLDSAGSRQGGSQGAPGAREEAILGTLPGETGVPPEIHIGKATGFFILGSAPGLVLFALLGVAGLSHGQGGLGGISAGALVQKLAILVPLLLAVVGAPFGLAFAVALKKLRLGTPLVNVFASVAVLSVAMGFVLRFLLEVLVDGYVEKPTALFIIGVVVVLGGAVAVARKSRPTTTSGP